MKLARLALVGLLFCMAYIQAQEPLSPLLSDFPQIKDLPNCLGREKVVGKYRGFWPLHDNIWFLKF